MAERPPSTSPRVDLPSAKPPSDHRLLTAHDVAYRWQDNVDHVYELTRRGVLPVVRLGRKYRYPLAGIEEFERSGGAA